MNSCQKYLLKQRKKTMKKVTNEYLCQNPLAICLALGLHAIGISATISEPLAEIISTKTICKQKARYIGWPTIAKTSKGELLVVFSGDRDSHVCPWGKTQMVCSRDSGKSWTQPVTINNSPLDDRDAGIIETAKGTLVVSWFTSLAFDSPKYVRDAGVDNRWQRHTEKLGPMVRSQWLGNWVRRSTDGGKSWGEFIDSVVTSPHGPSLLTDGRLMYVGINKKVGDSKSPQPLDEQLLAAAESTDDGKTWKIVGYIPVPDNVKPGAKAFYEPHMIETATSNLVAMFRHHGKPGQYYLWQSESTDNGRIWTKLHQTKIWGYPPHLLRLRNGWLVVSYGRRKPPYGIRACLSRDAGKTWDIEHEITLSKAHNGDLGYPASVQLDDGSILTVFYQIDKPGEKTCLMATHWRLNK